MIGVQSQQIFNQESSQLLSDQALDSRLFSQLPPDIVYCILKSITSTKSQLMASECSKHLYKVIFENNPTLMLIRDVVRCAEKTKYCHVEHKEPKHHGGLRNAIAYLPSSNKFLMYPMYDNPTDTNFSIKNYAVTSIDDMRDVAPHFISDVKKMIDPETYKNDKHVCERKLFFDLLTYASEKKAFVIDIGLKRIKSSDNLGVIRIMKREFGQSDCSNICCNIFRFSGECESGGGLDQLGTDALKSILTKNKIIIKPSLSPKKEASASIEESSKPKKEKRVKPAIQEEPIMVLKIVTEVDDACNCTLI